jgi:hypothetical protein
MKDTEIIDNILAFQKNWDKYRLKGKWDDQTSGWKKFQYFSLKFLIKI